MCASITDLVIPLVFVLGIFTIGIGLILYFVVFLITQFLENLKLSEPKTTEQ